MTRSRVEWRPGDRHPVQRYFYWPQDQSHVTTYIEKLASTGAVNIRVWVDTGTGWTEVKP